MSRVAAFDVNETMLDLKGLDPMFEAVFGDVSAKGEWFGTLLRTSMALTIAGSYDDFTTLGRKALETVAEAHGVHLDQSAPPAVGEAIRNLPPYGDVPDALDRLIADGWTLMAVTNSAQATAEAQLSNAGLADRFTHILSVDRVQRFKPAPEVYRMAADVAGVPPDQMWMVACHDWDLAGGSAVGCPTAFVERPGRPYSTAYPPPTVRARDMGELATQMIAAEA